MAILIDAKAAKRQAPKKPKGDSYKIYLRLLAYAKPFAFAFFIAVIANILYSAVDSYFAYLLKPILNKGFVSPDPQFIKRIPILIILLFMLRAAMNLIGSYQMGLVARGIIMRFRQNLFKHLLILPAKFHDNSATGQLLAMLIYNASQVASACTDALTSIVQSGALIIGLTIVMLKMSWQLTMLFFLSIPLIALVVKYCSRHLRRISRSTQTTIADITHVAEEALEGYKVVRLFHGEDYETKKFEKATTNNVKWEMRLIVLKAINTSSVQLIGVIVVAAMIYLATQHSFHTPPLSAGSFTAVIAAMMGMLKPMRDLSSVNATIQRGLAGAESIFEVLDIPPEPDHGKTQLTQTKGKIEYRNIQFAYHPQQTVLNDINFTIEPGQLFAFVGHSGSGKSTLINLLIRFYEPSGGQIFLDDQAIASIRLASFRQQLSLVTQHVTLFNDTIAANIAYGLPNCTAQQILAAAEAAHAMEFIEKLPEGLHTRIGENGLLLSGGQRQRLAIARAILKDAPILILDEATASLDTASERLIQAALETVMKNKTTLVIAHRLSTIERADKIIVLSHGKIIEQGTHRTLIQQENSHYKKLYQLQFTQSSGT